MKNISIIIPNYNGREYLSTNIPFLLKTLKDFKAKNEIIMVDDCSRDGSIEFVQKRFPSVRVFKTKENSGFGKACNLGIKKSNYDIVYLLNTDVKVTKGFMDDILVKFQEHDCFAVGSLENNRKKIFIPVIGFKWGMFIYNYEQSFSKEKYIEVVFVSAGHSAFDKKKFLKLGGFNEIYSPFLWEDMDICYLAGKRGWKSYYCSKSLVSHDKGGTIKKSYDLKKISTIHWRNRFLFLWSVIRGRLLIYHIIMLPFLVLGSLFFKREMFNGFMAAIPMAKQAFATKRSPDKCKDIDMIKKFRLVI
ncbi:MAG: glycosyltransferase family 2 protein [Candidatus Firestonebacteria bacterium]